MRRVELLRHAERSGRRGGPGVTGARHERHTEQVRRGHVQRICREHLQRHGPACGHGDRPK